jgi:small Trp-rich protein
MYLLGLGLILMTLKYLQVDPIAAWEWWVVLSPFGLAAVWWWWADWSGYTKRKVMEREDIRKQVRIDSNRQAMGLAPLKKKKR